MTATARPLPTPEEPIPADAAPDDALLHEGLDQRSTEYASARVRTRGRPHLRMVSPLRPERASRGLFALLVAGVLIAGMVAILLINTTLAQGAFSISELQAQRAALAEQEQALAAQVAEAAAPQVLEQRARELGMVPSQTPVFLDLTNGAVIGTPRAAPGGGVALPALLTPADATMTEAVDNASVGTDLPVAPGVDYDPAAADAAAAQAAAANAEPVLVGDAAGAPGVGAVMSAAAEIVARDRRQNSENSLWQDAPIIDVSGQVSTGDAGLVAVPVTPRR
jgi:cell division protein FtsB